MFPDKPDSRNYKTKESSVSKYIQDTFSEYDWSIDKTIQDGCSKKRPDLLLDLGYQVIIIEVDENKHSAYECSCENKRYMEISKDLNHRPIIFIRFTPAGYTSQAGSKILSSWGISNLGLSTIKKNKKREWNKRLERLKEEIEYWSNEKNKTNKTLEVIQLYYDMN